MSNGVVTVNNPLALSTEQGIPLPLGASKHENGINFSIACSSAKAIQLCFFDNEKHKLKATLDFDPKKNRSGNIWHLLVKNLPDNYLYAYRVAGDNADYSGFLVDPYAREVATGNTWGKIPDVITPQASVYRPLGEIILHDDFDWEGDTPLGYTINDLIIYEMHVRGFTKDPSSDAQNKGTFLGIVEKIPHLQELGVNAVELMPIHEFNELENDRRNPLNNSRLYNYWGYSTVNFFAPMKRYATTPKVGSATREFKSMVLNLHRAGIAVILDVVYNHTAEGNEQGPTLSFKGLDPFVWYQHNSEGYMLNFTGCGNTFNCNEPQGVELILDSLRYWVVEMHVDGFRFDLAPIFWRGNDGTPLALAPVLEAISKDPLLASTVLIAEPWDAAGLYQVGSFYHASDRWSEWNGKYRDIVRRFINGLNVSKGEFATRISGSQDLYGNGRAPFSSINFITAHDGFTLADLVSYNAKHNTANGEEDRDGMSWNDSWNCGAEGPSVNVKVLSLRQRQRRNFIMALLLSQGVPMILMGDEYGHTRRGNNNTYCQDNDLNWFLWDKLKENSALMRFTSKMVYFRKSHALLRRRTFLTDQDVLWHSSQPMFVHWENDEHMLAFQLIDHENRNDIYVAFNATKGMITVTFPRPPSGKLWHWIANSANTPPNDFFDWEGAPAPALKTYRMPNHSALILKAE